MQLPELSIRRPVFATVLSLLIVLVGVVSFNRLVIREYPKIDNPTVTVETRYVGASSAVMESQVTKVLEDSLSGVEGLDVISSISRQEQSQITVKFLLSRDPDAAAADVRDKVSRVRQRLPTGIDEPVISKVEADAFPVIWISFNSDTLNTLQLSDLANRLAKPMMQTAPGVADVRISLCANMRVRVGVRVRCIGTLTHATVQCLVPEEGRRQRRTESMNITMRTATACMQSGAPSSRPSALKMYEKAR